MQMLDYNVPGGKLNRGMAVGDILLHLTKDVRILSAFRDFTQLPGVLFNAASPTWHAILAPTSFAFCATPASSPCCTVTAFSNMISGCMCR